MHISTLYNAFTHFCPDIRKIILLKYAKFIQYKYWDAEFYMVNLHRLNHDAKNCSETKYWENEFERYRYLMYELEEILNLHIYRNEL